MKWVIITLTALVVVVGCCFGTSRPIEDKLKVPRGVERPKVGGIVVFKPDGELYSKFKPQGKYTAPDDHFIGLPAREMESLLSYIKALEAENDSFRKHPLFEVDNND